MTLRLVKNDQEYCQDYQIVHRPDADVLSRLPNDVPQWVSGEEDALRRLIPESTAFDNALFIAECDLGTSRTQSRAKNRKNKDKEDVTRHLKM